MNPEKIKYAYFLGIGGIGMSAIARYLISKGIIAAGYDKTPSELTSELANEGASIHFDDDIKNIPEFVFNHADETIIIYTPAIPADNKEFLHLKSENRSLYKRSEVLGIISSDSYCIAVAGTHGKTTTSTLIAHLLYEANINFTAFLGGISANYNTNFLQKTNGRNPFPGKSIVVLEADEFDRSFHRLNPDIAIITAVDPDHLDIYGTEKAFFEAFEIFASKIKQGGYLILNATVSWDFKEPEHVQTLLYSNDNADLGANFMTFNNEIKEGNFYFYYWGTLDKKLKKQIKILWDLYCGLPGYHNIENATAALGICYNLLNLDQYKIRNGLKSFRGTKRRFEFIVKNENFVVIDDYAHHPEEIDAIVFSVKQLYPDKKLTGIFQPHLFTRTRDFAGGFAESLAGLNALILMDIYPAREKPLAGITSNWLLEMVPLKEKMLMKEGEIIDKIKNDKPELLLILGAGDIDRIVPKIREVYDEF